MRSLLKALLVGCVSLSLVTFAGCGGSASLKKDTGKPDDAKSMYPSALEKLINGKYAKSITAVGIGTNSDVQVAREKADLDADQIIAKQFEQEISSLQKRFLEAVNDQKLEDYRNTVESFVNIKLQGVAKVKELVTEGKDGYKVYILKTLSAETIKNMIDERTNALTSFKAMKAYKELEDRVAKEKEAQAKPDPE